MKSVEFMASISGVFAAVIFAWSDERFATATLFKTLFAFEGVLRIEVLPWARAHECCKPRPLSGVERNIGVQPELFRF
jgi:hypothetical protein